MSEAMTAPQVETEAPKRRSKVAEEKAQLRDRLAAMVDKVPAKVNAGGIQTTREWVAENTKVQTVAAGGRQRMSRRLLREMVERVESWHA